MIQLAVEKSDMSSTRIFQIFAEIAQVSRKLRYLLKAALMPIATKQIMYCMADQMNTILELEKVA